MGIAYDIAIIIVAAFSVFQPENSPVYFAACYRR
jgi:hypothetical protein